MKFNMLLLLAPALAVPSPRSPNSDSPSVEPWMSGKNFYNVLLRTVSDDKRLNNKLIRVTNLHNTPSITHGELSFAVEEAPDPRAAAGRLRDDAIFNAITRVEHGSSHVQLYHKDLEVHGRYEANQPIAVLTKSTDPMTRKLMTNIPVAMERRDPFPRFTMTQEYIVAERDGRWVIHAPGGKVPGPIGKIRVVVEPVYRSDGLHFKLSNEKLDIISLGDEI